MGIIDWIENCYYPSLVYDPKSKKIFCNATVNKKNYPIPLYSINRHRFLPGLYNLTNFIACRLVQPDVANQFFLSNDDQDVEKRLPGDLQIDINKTTPQINWTPSSVKQEIKKIARWFLSQC